MLSDSVRGARVRVRENCILRSELERLEGSLASLAEDLECARNALDEEKRRNRVYRDEMEASLVGARERESRLEALCEEARARCDALQARCKELESACEHLRRVSERVQAPASTPQPRTPSAVSPSLAARWMPSAAPLSPALANAVALGSEARRARLAGILCSPANAGRGGGDSVGCAGARGAVPIACSAHAADHAADHRLGEQQSLCRLVYFAHRELRLSLEGDPSFAHANVPALAETMCALRVEPLYRLSRSHNCAQTLSDRQSSSRLTLCHRRRSGRRAWWRTGRM